MKSSLTKRVSVSSECEGVDGPVVLYLTRRLEVGGGVRRSAAPSPHQEDPGGLGLLLLSVLEEHTRVVTRGVYELRAGVVNLQHQVLDVGVASHLKQFHE